MLAKIRNSKNSTFIRIFLGVVAISFFGGSVLIQSGSKDVITFDKADSISLSDFTKYKRRYLNKIENSFGMLSEDSQINNFIARQLINQRIIEYLSNCYDFKISNELILKYVKHVPDFLDDDDKFNPLTFKAIFSTKSQEDEYLKSVNDKIIKASLLEIFSDSYHVPKLTENMIIDYMSEERIIDIFSIRKDIKSKLDRIYDQKILHEFYEKNREMFLTQEARELDYLAIDRKFLESKIVVSESEAREFFAQNPDQFTGIYEESEADIKEYLFDEKLYPALDRLVKEIEEDISYGMSMEEISSKYDIDINSVSMLANGDSKEFNNSQILDIIFDMSEGEISYPVEIEEDRIFVFQLKSITQSRYKKFEKIREDILAILHKRDLVEYNTNKFYAFHKEYKNSYKEKTKDINILIDKSLIRSDLASTKLDIPSTLLTSIFSIVGSNNKTGIFDDGTKLYFAYLKDIKINKEKVKQLSQYKDHFSNVIREGAFQELVDYLVKINYIKVRDDLLQ